MPTGSGLSAQLGAVKETYTNEQQTLTGTPSATFTLTFEGATTATSLATNAAAAAVQAALEALPNIGTGGVSCSGGPLPAAITVTFSGPLVSGRDVSQLVVQSGVTGLTAATTVPGKGYGDANTPNRFYEFESEDLKLNIEQLKGGGIRAGNAYQRADRRRQGKRQAGGGINLEVHNKGFGFWLEQIFGKAAVITTPSGGTTARDQTFTLGDGWNTSVGVQVGRPDSQSDAGNVNPSQASPQVRLRRVTSPLQVGVTLSPSGSWGLYSGSYGFSDPTTELLPGGWFSTETPAYVSLWAAGDFIIAHYKAVNDSRSSGFHVEVPQRLYPQNVDPNPMAWLTWSNATPSQVAGTYYNGFTMFDHAGTVRQWTTLVRSPMGTKVRSDYTGNAYGTGQWQQFGLPAFRFALISLDLEDMQYLTTDGILSQPLAAQFSASRARLAPSPCG